MSEPDFEQFAIREVLSHSTHVIAVIDPDMIVRWMSASGAIYGLDPVGQVIDQLIHPDDLARATQAFDAVDALGEVERSLMASATVPVRLVGTSRLIPFDASGRWESDDEGRWWLVVILQDATTRYAIDIALRKLAAGVDEHEAIQAVIAASHEYGGVTGAQMSWQQGGRLSRTLGDLGDQPGAAEAVLSGLGPVSFPGLAVVVDGSDWGFVLPVIAGTEQLGLFALWGVGPQPALEFVSAAFSPLLDIAALALKRAHEHAELRRQATTDLVTGLLNRHAFFAALDGASTKTAILYIDLDGFKAVNDEFGHMLGDRLLSVVARRLIDAVSDADVLGRIGGDEFAVLCRSVTAAQARAAGERVIGALNQTFVIDGQRLVTGASIGIAYAEVATEGRLLLDYADRALLEAKAQGKGRAVVLAAL